MMTNSNEIIPCKTLQDIIDKSVLDGLAMEHWEEMPINKRKQKGARYNKVLKNVWKREQKFEWKDEYEYLNHLQKRLLIKRELINEYNTLSSNDRDLLHQYLGITSNATKWYLLPEEDKKKLIQLII